ncbi:LPS-assembly lipoprotein [Breoghania corrubedonensis]|uniref:LPS-assembly lipoprotein n=1 Tax=Breoghania corrubedonensis TaxID=665038 RepID=A0A2T5VI44_9HYPH|nr:LPS assembly lipoprotein LptE [Breoghania corrubedonensis]PTW63388.1 LPS-assembly lipoprotein [Breoghania corrubedonensis]
MSLSDFTGRFRVLGLVCALFVLAGCNVRPLYGTISTGSAPAQEELAAIDIDPADDRVQQVLRNELIFLFQRGGEAAPARYRLRMILNSTKSSVAVEELSDVPAAYLVQMTTSFALSEVATGRTLLTGSTFANASYDFSNQRFANLRAARDAEDRAAKVIADDIHTRIAAYFAEQKS